MASELSKFIEDELRLKGINFEDEEAPHQALMGALRVEVGRARRGPGGPNARGIVRGVARAATAPLRRKRDITTYERAPRILLVRQPWLSAGPRRELT